MQTVAVSPMTTAVTAGGSSASMTNAVTKSPAVPVLAPAQTPAARVSPAVVVTLSETVVRATTDPAPATLIPAVSPPSVADSAAPAAPSSPGATPAPAANLQPATESGETTVEAGERADAPATPASEEDSSQPAREARESSRETPETNQPGRLSEEEVELVERLQSRDQEVRQHEAAHQAVGGQYAGAASFTYQRGPDGQSYAVGGEVPIDVSPVANDPQATIDKMRVVRAAALAPPEPSQQDRQVAALAMQTMMQAQAELTSERAASSRSQVEGATREFTTLGNAASSTGAGPDANPEERSRSLGNVQASLYRAVQGLATAADFQNAPLVSDFA